MKKSTPLLAAAGLFAATIGATSCAQAAYPCGPGYTLQGGVCKPYRGPNVRYYDNYGPGRYYGPEYRRYHRKPCPEGYTVQDGVCKPYVGPNVPYR